MRLVVRTLSDQVAGLVRDHILSGHVPPDSPIRQDALASELGISKIPLREALAKLEQEGLVHSQAHRGFFVSPLKTSEAEEVYALRLRLEPDTAALAAELATESDQSFAIETMATLDQVSAQGDGVGAFNRAFHLAILRPSGQLITVNILERLHVLSERYVRKHLEPLGRDERANEEHRAILEAWLARDVKRVRALSTAHVEKTLSDLRQQLAVEA